MAESWTSSDLVGKGKRVELKSQLEVQCEFKASLVRADLKK